MRPYTLAGAFDHFAGPRGEFTLAIEGALEGNAKYEAELDVDAELRRLKSQGLRARDAVRQVAQGSGRSHRQVYERWLALAKR